LRTGLRPTPVRIAIAAEQIVSPLLLLSPVENSTTRRTTTHGVLTHLTPLASSSFLEVYTTSYIIKTKTNPKITVRCIEGKDGTRPASVFTMCLAWEIELFHHFLISTFTRLNRAL
jgi:hypothetical protein